VLYEFAWQRWGGCARSLFLLTGGTPVLRRRRRVTALQSLGPSYESHSPPRRWSVSGLEMQVTASRKLTDALPCDVPTGNRCITSPLLRRTASLNFDAKRCLHSEAGAFLQQRGWLMYLRGVCPACGGFDAGRHARDPEEARPAKGQGHSRPASRSEPPSQAG
jgi:hypothetical protein